MYTNAMPELPEVEAARRLLMRSAVGRRIVGVRVTPAEVTGRWLLPPSA